MLPELGFEAIDLVAVSFFFFAWICHYWLVYYSPLRNRSITHHMVESRQRWMLNMMSRENRMVDGLIQNSLQQGVLFFASTSILVVGALLAGLGVSDQAVAMLSELPTSTTTTRAEWDIKVLLVVFIFVFAFFKFAWSYRLYNYVIIMIGAAPEYEVDAEATYRYAMKVASLQALGARHFTTGVNSYFFALSAISWFLNAWLFIAATFWVFLVLYRRAFRSKFVKILTV